MGDPGPGRRPVSDDQYCIRVTRHTLDPQEDPESMLNIHQSTEAEIRGLLDLVIRSLAPGDRAEIVLWRGHHD